MIDIKPLYEHNIPWECFQSPNSKLVYFLHYKCCTTAANLLFNKLGWNPITIDRLDWDKSVVFSHIRHPLIKHRKGIVEGLLRYPYVFKTVLNDKNFLEFVSNIASIDGHSLTLYRMLGHKALQINWIPIDLPGVDPWNYAFTTIMYNFGERLDPEIIQWFNSQGKINKSTANEIECYNKIMSIDTPDQIKNLIDFDLCLYNQVVDPCSPNTFLIHQRIKQLIEHGATQNIAEATARHDIEIGNHLTWSF
jgi:hypothetical protein